MRKLLIVLLCLAWPGLALASAPAAAPAAASAPAVSVEILETWPSANTIVLPRNKRFYLRLAYRSDEKIGIWVRPMFHGKPARAGSNPSGRYVGEGEALGWFFIMDTGAEVDEIRVVAGNGGGVGSGDEIVASLRVQMIGGEPAEATTAQPEWVDRLRGQADAALAELRREAASQPTSAGEAGLIAGVIALALVLCVLGVLSPAWGLWRWRGGWRIAAAVPAVMMGLVLLNILVGVIIDPTSHNLWPFEVLMWGLASLAIMVVLALARWIGRRRQQAG